ncbi:MAG: hypothetical protein ACK5M7_01980 [Draconibacterium sp.]
MELEELKQAWLEYDNKLSSGLKTNHLLLRKMNLNHAKAAMATPLYYELFSFVIVFALLIGTVSSTIRFASSTKLLISGGLTILWLIVSLVLTARKIKGLSNLNFYNASVLEIQKQLALVQKRYQWYKKFEFYTFPVFAVVAIPVGVKAVHGFDIFEYPWQYVIGVTLALAIGYPLAIWIYKNWYDKKLQDTNEVLTELDQFEQESD